MNPTHLQATYMGQWLLNPPSVEGWHWGTEWIDSGALVERVNFASERLGNLSSPGVQAIVDHILSNNSKSGLVAEDIVETALSELSITKVSEQTRSALVTFAKTQLDQDSATSSNGDSEREKVASILKVIGATPEFQRA
jgi:hypothetical protein